VLLPQGAFDKFLKGNIADRRQILMRLLDLGRYDSAGRLARGEAARLDAVLGERGALIEANYQDATATRLKELKDALKEARGRYRQVEKASRDARKIAVTSTASEKHRETLEQAASDIAEAVTAIAPLVESWPTLEKTDLATDSALKVAADQLKTAEAALKRTRATHIATVKKTGDAATLAVLDQAATALSTEEATIAALDGELAAVGGEAKTAAKAVATATKQATVAGRALEKQIEQLSRSETERDVAQAVLVHAEAAATATALESELKKAATAHEKMKQKADETAGQRRHLEHEHSAAALRAGLEPGDPCPVCASVIEVVPKTDEDIESVLAQARDQVAEAEALEREMKERVIELKAQAKVAAKALAEATADINGEAAVDPKEARRLLEKAELAIVEGGAQRQHKQISAEQARQELASFEKEVASIDSKIGGANRLREAAVKRLEDARTIVSTGFPSALPKDLKGAIQKRRDALMAADKTLSEAQQNADAAKSDLDERQTARQECQQEIAKFDQEISAAQAAAKLCCQALGRLLAETALPKLPEPTDHRTRLLADWQTCCEGHLVEAERAVTELTEGISGAVGEMKHLAATSGIELQADESAAIADEIDQAVTSCGRAVAGAEKDVEAHSKRITERAELETGISKDRVRLALYQALARELRADRFIAFVLEESMSVLAVQASEELLRISDGRYSLVADEGSFEVIDHHNADELRSVATLSGGETFLASLSLALSLSVGLRELAGVAANRLEAMFIDEGFGALDVDTLDVVVDALERLGEGDRMVGVISHVETLAQRIPAGLAVQTDGGSSKILAR
jgi:exonuclease SbcC